jgi:hypothetical protein
MVAGYQVFAVNPVSVSRYRDRHAVSGAKSDPGRRAGTGGPGPHRPAQPPARLAAGDSDLAEAVKVLARAHQSMIWSRRQHANLCVPGISSAALTSRVAHPVGLDYSI